jgi:hypothetical protein
MELDEGDYYEDVCSTQYIWGARSSVANLSSVIGRRLEVNLVRYAIDVEKAAVQ